MRIFFYYSISLFLLFIPVFYYRFVNPSDENRILFLRFFLITEFTFLSLFFYHIINSRIVKLIILLAIIPFILFSIYDYFNSKSILFSYIPLVIECLTFLSYILYFFYEKMRSNTVVPAYQTRPFWIAVAFTLFCSGNFFLFLFSNTTVKDELYKLQFTIIYSTFTILKNLFISIGLIIKVDNENINLTPKEEDIWEIPSEFKKTNL
jgi:hypothetical protein